MPTGRGCASAGAGPNTTNTLAESPKRAKHKPGHLWTPITHVRCLLKLTLDQANRSVDLNDYAGVQDVQVPMIIFQILDEWKYRYFLQDAPRMENLSICQQADLQ